MSKPFRQLVGEHIGRASMCWDPNPHGVFDSTTASALCDDIVREYDKLKADAEKLVAALEAIAQGPNEKCSNVDDCPEVAVQALKAWRGEK